MTTIASYFSEIVSFVLGIGAGSFLTIQVTKNRAGSHGSAINQSGASAGGDVVGRDKGNTR
jgi:hypothetical protein